MNVMLSVFPIVSTVDLDAISQHQVMLREGVCAGGKEDNG
jgi:hypothetical protein